MGQKRYYFKIDAILKNNLKDIKKDKKSYDIWCSQVNDPNIKNNPDEDEFLANFEIEDMRIFITSKIVNGKHSNPEHNKKSIVIFGYSATSNFGDYKKKIKDYLKKEGNYCIKEMKKLCLYINRTSNNSCDLIEFDALSWSEKLNKFFLWFLGVIGTGVGIFCLIYSIIKHRFESVSFSAFVSILIAIVTELFTKIPQQDKLKLESIIPAVQFEFENKIEEPLKKLTKLKGR